VAWCCECGDEPLGSGAKELVICRYAVPELLFVPEFRTSTDQYVLYPFI
jgi:hypothetical protein